MALMNPAVVRKPLPSPPPRTPIREMYEDITLLGKLNRLPEAPRFFKGWCYVLGKWCYYRTDGDRSELSYPQNYIVMKFSLIRRLFSAIAEAQPVHQSHEVFEWADEDYQNTGDHSGWCYAGGEWRYYVKEGETHLVSPPSNNTVHRILGAVLRRLPEPF